LNAVPTVPLAEVELVMTGIAGGVGEAALKEMANACQYDPELFMVQPNASCDVLV
jgi:hypothetical protein